MHSPSHAFCTQDQVYILEILLDTEKLYPLIFRLVGKRGECFAGEFFSGYLGVVRNYYNWFSIY